VLRSRADVAVFPNRCEGGMNLVAMEAIATGVSVILANGTGQADLIDFLPPGWVGRLIHTWRYDGNGLSPQRHIVAYSARRLWRYPTLMNCRPVLASHAPQ
jgi:glycosyltransferase involved in cell wall biosynthesis